MRHDKVGIVILEVSRNNREHQARETPDGKQNDKRNRKQHWRFKSHRPLPHGRYPIEHFHTRGHSDQHGCIHKVEFTRKRNPNSKHVVRPYDERQEGNRRRCINHRVVTEQAFASKRRNDCRHNTERRQDHDINLRVPKEPEYMLEQYRVTTTTGVKKRGAKVNVH